MAMKPSSQKPSTNKRLSNMEKMPKVINKPGSGSMTPTAKKKPVAGTSPYPMPKVVKGPSTGAMGSMTSVPKKKMK